MRELLSLVPSVSPCAASFAGSLPTGEAPAFFIGGGPR